MWCKSLTLEKYISFRMKWFFSPPFLSVSPFLLLNLVRRRCYAYAIDLYTRPEIKSWPDVKFCAHAHCVLPRCWLGLGVVFGSWYWRTYPYDYPPPIPLPHPCANFGLYGYPLCNDIFDRTPQFCLHRAVYVLMDTSTAKSSPAQMSPSFATDNLVVLSFPPKANHFKFPKG